MLKMHKYSVYYARYMYTDTDTVGLYFGLYFTKSSRNFTKRKRETSTTLLPDYINCSLLKKISEMRTQSPPCLRYLIEMGDTLP